MARNVLVTGSSSGIGAATAIAFAMNGDNVGITYNRKPDDAEKVAEKCRSYGVRAEIFGGDISKREVVEQMMNDFFEKFGTIDVLINNAGGALTMPEGGFEKMPLEYWESQIGLNLNAPAYFSHFAMKNMIENNIKGSIVNISSVHSLVPWVRRKTLPYAAAKAGLNMLTKNLGIEAIHYGIHVNCIAPGFIATKATDRYDQGDLEKGFLRKIPAGYLGNTDDIVPMILFLTNNETNRFIVGETIVIDGGQSVDGSIDKMLDDGKPVNAYQFKADMENYYTPATKYTLD